MAWDIMQPLHRDNQLDVINVMNRMPVNEQKCFRAIMRYIDYPLTCTYGSKRAPTPAVEEHGNNRSDHGNHESNKGGNRDNNSDNTRNNSSDDSNGHCSNNKENNSKSENDDNNSSSHCYNSSNNNGNSNNDGNSSGDNNSSNNNDDNINSRFPLHASNGFLSAATSIVHLQGTGENGPC